MKVYWDACAWIGLINEEADKVRGLEYFYTKAKANEIEIWTSLLNYAEVFKYRFEDGNPKPWPEESAQKIRDIIEQPFVVRLNVDFNVAVKARELLRTVSDLKRPNDAIHLASALLFDVDEMHTYDRPHLLALDGKVPRADGTLLKICVPAVPGNAPLLDAGV
jgi:predicted nucleic acid-binding protein